MIADWKLYELILFNIVQNSFKYNKIFDGDVVITLECKQAKQGNEQQLIHNDEKVYVLETQVIDTGVGIPLER
jgi:signal transduction histidine kinase